MSLSESFSKLFKNPVQNPLQNPFQNPFQNHSHNPFQNHFKILFRTLFRILFGILQDLFFTIFLKKAWKIINQVWQSMKGNFQFCLKSANCWKNGKRKNRKKAKQFLKVSYFLKDFLASSILPKNNFFTFRHHSMIPKIELFSFIF